MKEQVIRLAGMLLSLVLVGCGPSTAVPTPVSSPLPTSTVPPLPTSAYTPARLVVSCNAKAALSLRDYWTGEEVHHAVCTQVHEAVWTDLRWGGRYSLHYESAELGVEGRLEVGMHRTEEEVAVLLPGILEIKPVPEDAEVEVDGVIHRGRVWLSYPAEECPYTATVWVWAAGYYEDGRFPMIEAGRVKSYLVELTPLPTPAPARTSPPATRPARTPLPTTPPWTVEERVALVRQKLYESVNCIRAENGLPPLPYLSEWQAMADDFARGWRDYYLAHGVEGFDSSPWRQQFRAVGGDAVPESAGVPLYASERYRNLNPQTHWENFDMCNPTCPAYGMFQVREQNIVQASGVVIGLAPWWEGDILNAALIIGFKW